MRPVDTPLPKLSRLTSPGGRSSIRGPRKRDVVRKVMQANRSTGTQPEVAVERLLRGARIPFARHVASVLGKPDFVVRHKVAIFVDGDFWHGFRFALWKGQLSAYWVTKIQRTRRRDRRTFAALRRQGWKVIRIWEHQLVDPSRVLSRIRGSLDEARSRGVKGSE